MSNSKEYPHLNRLIMLNKYFDLFRVKNDLDNMTFCLLHMRILQGQMSARLHDMYSKINGSREKESKEIMNEYYYDVSIYEGIIDTCKQIIKECEIAMSILINENNEQKNVAPPSDSAFNSKIKRDPLNLFKNDEKIGAGNIPRLINFYSDTCGFCHKLKPVWQQLKQKVGGKNIKIDEIECGQNAEIMKKYDIDGFPTVKLFKNDNETKTIVGYNELDVYTDLLDKELGIKLNDS
jgi:thiol-disulfide isomerase/thioredoxin